MPQLLDGKDKSKAFLFNWVVANSNPNQGSTEIIDGLLGTFTFFCASIVPKKWSMALTYSKNDFSATGGAKTRGLVRYALNSSKVFSQASSQTKDTPFFH